jgi:hypothetical protein
MVGSGPCSSGMPQAGRSFWPCPGVLGFLSETARAVSRGRIGTVRLGGGIALMLGCDGCVTF